MLLFPDGGWLVDLTPLPHLEEKAEEEEEVEDFWTHFEPGRALDTAPEDLMLLQHLEPQIAAREQSRAHQLTTLRSIYIPQVCVRVCVCWGKMGEGGDEMTRCLIKMGKESS